MKIILYPLVCAAVALGACNNSAATEAEMELARATGRADAMKAVVEDSGSMPRERAIFAIRGRETMLRDAGFTTCADIYISEAEKVLRDSLVIE